MITGAIAKGQRKRIAFWWAGWYSLQMPKVLNPFYALAAAPCGAVSYGWFYWFR
jgi:hypothetical protein